MQLLKPQREFNGKAREHEACDKAILMSRLEGVQRLMTSTDKVHKHVSTQTGRLFIAGHIEADVVHQRIPLPALAPAPGACRPATPHSSCPRTPPPF